MDTERKLAILSAAAKYDVACTSCGVDRDARIGALGSTMNAGICHSFAADGRCITLLKVLMTNMCVFDCKYCANRVSNDIPRAAFSPRELADLTMAFYRRNFIEGLFVSSGVIRDPDYTMENMCKCISILREEYDFNGYIHAKAIPGASPDLIDKLGRLVDRMSINIELPSDRSLKLLAPDKRKENLLAPMAHIAEKRRETGLAPTCMMERRPGSFVPAGQSTQLIVGATPETDLDILKLSAGLYKKYELKRVFFSAYLPINSSQLLPDRSVEVPLNREHRLYQADWLLRFYQFSADEIVDDKHPWLDPLLDPKANWAVNHLDVFPIEVNTAPYEMLLRVPGLGVRGAKLVMRARRHCTLQPESFKKLGLSLSRMQYFITCDGKYVSPLPFDRECIYSKLAAKGVKSGKTRRSGGKLPLEGQLAMFDELESPALEAATLSPRELASAGLPAGGVPALQTGQLLAFQAQQRALAALEVAPAPSAISIGRAQVPQQVETPQPVAAPLPVAAQHPIETPRPAGARHPGAQLAGAQAQTPLFAGCST